jgi:tetratricopeptide (TPR) repeat protein
MAVGTELRIGMAGNRFRAVVLVAVVGVSAAQGALLVWAQSSASTSSDSPSSSSSSTSGASGSGSNSHQTVHHVQVPDEDSPTQPAELTQAESAIEKKNYAAAEPLLRKLVGRDPSNFEGWFDLGFVENAMGKVEESIAAYRQSVAAKPEVFESNLNLGLQLAKTGQPDAEKFLRAATQLTPTSHVAEGQYRAWLALGDTLKSLRPDEALAAYREAASLQPKEAEPHLEVGLLLEQENKPADAEQEYKRAMVLDAASSEAAVALANLYMHGRRFPEAEGALRKLAAERPASAVVEIQLGRVLAAEGKYDEAIAAMLGGMKLAPGDETAQQDLADLYTAAEKNDLAESAYRGLLQAHPNNAELHRRLGQALLRQKKFPAAQQEFLLAVKLKPDLGEAYGDLAFAGGENADYQLVLRALDTRARYLPEIPITYFLRASAYDHLHDWKTAAVNYHLFLNSAQGLYPDYEWKAKHRLIAIEPKK